MSTRPRRRVAEAPPAPLRVVRGRPPRRSALVPAALVLILAIFAVAALQAYLGQEGLRVARLEQQVQEAEERYAVLRAEIAERSSPERVAGAAEELGMVPGHEEVYLQAPGALPEAGEASVYSSKRLRAGLP